MRPTAVWGFVCRNLVVAIGMVAAVAWAAPARAQLNGENILGDLGVKSGTQAEPGVYVSYVYYRYFTDSIRDANGKQVTLDPTGAASQTIQANVPVVNYITSRKVLGAHFGMMAVLPFANGSLEAPGIGLSEKASIGLSDLYVMPAQLGWHFRRADAVAGVAFFAPTGRHTAGASDNLGKGMWSYEVSGGGTVYADNARTISLSTAAFWETHSKKDGEVLVGPATVSDVKVGQILTLEGGVAKSFLHGAASIGAAYYAQWKLTPDEMTVSAMSAEPVSIPAQHRVFAIGPDVTIPIATRTRLISLVNVRYLWETGVEAKTQGRTFLLTWTVPVGGITIPGKGN
jgi:hypothetical protein